MKNTLSNTISPFVSKVFFIASILGAPAFADDHAQGTIIGTNTDLKTNGHSFAGVVENSLVLGNFDHDTFSSTLSLVHNDKQVNTTFARENEILAGMISYPHNDAVLVTTMQFVKVDPLTQSITLKINNEDVNVKITSEKFENKHFINPTYTARIENRDVSFTLTGQACYGYSTHLSMMLFAAHSFGMIKPLNDVEKVQ